MGPWLQRWSAAASVLSWDPFGKDTAPGDRVRLLAQLNGAATWLLQQRQRAAVWVGQALKNESPLRITARAVCSAAAHLLCPQAACFRDLVLGAEACGLGASVRLAELERTAASGGMMPSEEHGCQYTFGTLTCIYHMLSTASSELAEPDLSSVPGGAKSLVGAAEAILRLSAALARQLQLTSASVIGARERRTAESERQYASCCCALGVEAAARLLRLAALQPPGSDAVQADSDWGLCSTVRFRSPRRRVQLQRCPRKNRCLSASTHATACPPPSCLLWKAWPRLLLKLERPMASSSSGEAAALQLDQCATTPYSHFLAFGRVSCPKGMLSSFGLPTAPVPAGMSVLCCGQSWTQLALCSSFSPQQGSLCMNHSGMQSCSCPPWHGSGSAARCRLCKQRGPMSWLRSSFR